MTFFITSGVDRWGMVEAISKNGGKLIIGDLMFALNIAIPLHSIGSLRALGSVILPIAANLPLLCYTLPDQNNWSALRSLYNTLNKLMS